MSAIAGERYRAVHARSLEDPEGFWAEQARAIILDLRDNPGGLLDTARKVVNEFIDHGVIVSTHADRPTSNPPSELDADAQDLETTLPLIVLVNQYSASASEIVSGALKDWHRGLIVGQRTFGKGSVQTILPLGENGALKLTTARYYTPSDRSIQAKGIDPDIRVLENIPDDLKGKVSSMGEASLFGHLKNDGEEEKGSDAYVPPDHDKDTQLAAAVQFLHGARAETLRSPDSPATVTSQ